MIVSYASARVTEPVAGIMRRVLANSRNIMLTEHLLEKGAVLPQHRHPHEQLVYLLSGELLLEINGEQFLMKQGDSLVIPSNEKCCVLDIFTPSREDYL
jgi:quercetin dioxygenase-like cupin family protein